jgi:hypothetical protein
MAKVKCILFYIMLADTMDLLWVMTYSHNRYRKAQLGFLFSVGIFIVAVVSVRLPKTLHNVTSETYRISWTTAEFLAATFVANAPVLYSFQRLFQKKHSRAALSSRSGPQSEEVS